MLKGLVRDITLAIQARSGLTPGSIVWFVVAAIAAATMFAFLCVAGYVWVSRQLGPVFAGLVMAGTFLLIALIGAGIGAILRRRARQRAALERAARAEAAAAASSSWLLDPKILGIAMQVGRAPGWQRVIPVALLGLLAAQWLLSGRKRSSDTDEPA
jgi:hypothetical protein